jgi:hypothetical protein
MRGAAEVVYGIVRVGCYIMSKMLHQRPAAAHSRGLLSEHEFYAKKLKNSVPTSEYPLQRPST